MQRQTVEWIDVEDYLPSPEIWDEYLIVACGHKNSPCIIPAAYVACMDRKRDWFTLDHNMIELSIIAWAMLPKYDPRKVSDEL